MKLHNDIQVGGNNLHILYCMYANTQMWRSEANLDLLLLQFKER